MFGKSGFKSYRDKVVVVTGAAAGLGREMSMQLAASGARVWAADRDRNSLEKLQQTGVKNLATKHCDVTKIGELRKLADTVVRSEGRIDV